MTKIGRKVFVLLFFAILCYPLYGGFLGRNIQLSGVTQQAEQPRMEFSAIWTGDYQTQANTYYEQNFSGRSLLIKLRSQLMYSLLNESPNENVVIGKEHQLYEPGYILREEPALNNVSDQAYFDELKTKLLSLRDLLAQHGKELYIFVTPSKAHYEMDSIPLRYKLLGTDQTNDFTNFKKMLQTTDLSYFISRDYIDSLIGSSECPQALQGVPLFYSTGIHWSRPWANYAAAAFYQMIQQQSSIDLSNIAVDVAPYEGEIEWPDADLYQSLNLFAAPDEQYYTASVHITQEGEKPNVFCRGGSFMGQSWYALEEAGCFNNSLHYENNFYRVISNGEISLSKSLSAFDAYSESTEWIPYLQQSDIVVLEINEASIYNASFKWMDYVLENPDVLG